MTRNNPLRQLGVNRFARDCAIKSIGVMTSTSKVQFRGVPGVGPEHCTLSFAVARTQLSAPLRRARFVVIIPTIV